MWNNTPKNRRLCPAVFCKKMIEYSKNSFMNTIIHAKFTV